eukprot:SAG31_NODE_1725_length_7439_cov_7.440037_3_plen_43_part_00
MTKGIFGWGSPSAVNVLPVLAVATISDEDTAAATVSNNRART